MKTFSQLNIKPASKCFEGDKIKITRILGKEIVVHAYRIEDSKVFKERGTGKCLHLQISINGTMYVIFTSSSGLIDAIQQVSENEFPFLATIVEKNDRFLFT